MIDLATETRATAGLDRARMEAGRAELGGRVGGVCGESRRRVDTGRKRPRSHAV